MNHYRHPLVTGAIQHHSSIGDSWRCGNFDFHGWWKRVDVGADKLQKLYVLPDPGDYSLLIDKGRTLYWSLNFFEDSIRTQHRHKPPDGVKGAVVGEYATTIAYSLGVDIDHADGTNVFDAKDALEAAGSFFIGRLHDIGITVSYDVLSSGGGIYILLHPAISVCPTPDAKRTTRARWFYLLAMTYNEFINDVQRQFFEVYPEHRGMVKFDALNNSKRIFKSLFSIHNKHPFACIPLDKNKPQIDFISARPPLSDDILRSGLDWLSDYNMAEYPAMVCALQKYEDQIKEQQSVDCIDTEIIASDTPIDVADFPPCINAAMNRCSPPAGGTRMVAFFSAYLGQCGWNRQNALVSVMKMADRFGMSRESAERYFSDWFLKMHCPSCDTVRTTGAHYPGMNMGELELCAPDQYCDGIYNPIKYKYVYEPVNVEI